MSTRARITALAAGGVALAVLVAVVVTVVVTGKGTGRHTSTSTTASTPGTATTSTTAATTTTFAGGPVPAGFQPQSVTFVSAREGMVLGAAPCAEAPCAAVVARTTDAGATWRALDAPGAPLVAARSGTAGVSKLRFADDENGWAFGSELWSTHDGGRTWGRVTISGAGPGATVIDLETASGLADALVQTGAGTTGQGTIALYQSPAGSDSWTPVAGVDATNAGDGSIVLHGLSGWVLISTSGDGGSGREWKTVDGRTFAPATPAPCPPPAGLPAILAASSNASLAAACAGGVAAGQEQKTVLVSSDGGRTWAATSARPPLGGTLDGLATPDPSTIVLGASSGASWIYASFDGGSSWETVYTDDKSGGIPFADLGFTTTSQGVMIEGIAAISIKNPSNPSFPPARLLMTTDGGHSWAAVSF